MTGAALAPPVIYVLKQHKNTCPRDISFSASLALDAI